MKVVLSKDIQIHNDAEGRTIKVTSIDLVVDQTTVAYHDYRSRSEYRKWLRDAINDFTETKRIAGIKKEKEITDNEMIDYKSFFSLVYGNGFGWRCLLIVPLKENQQRGYHLTKYVDSFGEAINLMNETKTGWDFEIMINNDKNKHEILPISEDSAVIALLKYGDIK